MRSVDDETEAATQAWHDRARDARLALHPSDPDRLDPCVCGDGCEILHMDEGWPAGAVCFDGGAA